MMPAMKMMFHVKNKTELETIKVGDKVEFTLEDSSGSETITTVKKVK
jgi:Cu/Ag efflux protein CusF